MAQTVFFSWQSDTPTDIGRNFIRSALEEACKKLSTDTSIDEPVRDLMVDSDTKNTAGHAPIVDTIFKKIDTASVYVGDMTFVGTRVKEKGLIPNPNVLIEYGWALKNKTHERVILLMNAAYGEPSSEVLPFNMRHVVWPVTYSLPEDATAEQKKKEKERLAKILAEAIRASLDTLPPNQVAVSPGFIEAEAKEKPARFRAAGESIGFDNDFGDTKGEVFLKSGPAIWLRLMPTAPLGRTVPSYELQRVANISGNITLLPISGSGWDFLQAEDGFGIYLPDKSLTPQENVVHTNSVAFAFETGEVWSIDTVQLEMDPERMPFLEPLLNRRFLSYTKFLKDLGVDAPYKWEAGVTGVRGRYMKIPMRMDSFTFNEDKVCMSDTISVSGTFDGVETPTKAMLPFFEKVFAKCGVPRPEHLPT